MISEYEITSVAGALSIVAPDKYKDFLQPILGRSSGELGTARSGRPRTFPLGVWFRGQSDAAWRLEPSVFRRCGTARDGSKTDVFYEEAGLFHHFRSRVAANLSRKLSTFDWLCLMRHHILPTRLLDWSESILVALYFAVAGDTHDKRDSCLSVLNAYRLNDYAGLYGLGSGIVTPTTYDVLIRASMTMFDTYLDVLRHTKKLECEDFAFPKIDFEMPEVKALMHKPIAVFPHRFHERMIVQSSVFTLHGGKLFFDAGRSSGAGTDRLNAPTDIDELDFSLSSLEKHFLIHFKIPAACRAAIRRHLYCMGVHQGMLFPDYEHQAEFIAQQWRTERRIERPGPGG